MSARAADTDWPGKRFGLPDAGPRSIARFGRRLIAITIDWLLGLLISYAFIGQHNGVANPWGTLGVFAVIQILFLVVIGATPGHLVVRMRLVPVTGGRVTWWRPIWRTALLCLVIPAVIWDKDQRGVHDRSAGTMLVRI